MFEFRHVCVMVVNIQTCSLKMKKKNGTSFSLQRLRHNQVVAENEDELLTTHEKEVGL